MKQIATITAAHKRSVARLGPWSRSLGLFFTIALPLILFQSGCHDMDSPATKNDSVSIPGPTLNANAEASLSRPNSTGNSAKISERLERMDDPSQDGWNTELFNNLAGKQLSSLGTILKHPAQISSANLEPLIASNFTCSGLVPESMETLFQDKTLEATRWNRDNTKHVQIETSFNGARGFRDALSELMRPFLTANKVRTKFKIFRVEPSEGMVATRQYAEIAGFFDDGSLELHTDWLAEWDNKDPTAPVLTSLKLMGMEQVRSQIPSGTLFSDCTESILDKNTCYQEQFLRGYMYWLSASQQMRYLITDNLGTPGIALGDINGDGLDDLYVCQEQGLPNRLFLHQNDGSAEDVSDKWGVDWLEDSRSPLFVDIDNDGDQDLLVAFHGGIIVASNEDGQRFTVRTIIPSDKHLMSLAAADYDNDGDLDIYATAFLTQWRGETGAPIPQQPRVYHDGNNGGQNALFQNNIQEKDWEFEDVTENVGLNVNNNRFSFAVSWEDYDNDGDQDLYVANDFGRDNLYRNDEGHFVDVSSQAGAEDAASGMGITWGDYDRDGWFDIHVSNMWSSAGGRIAFQPKFMQDADTTVKQRMQSMARGNTLLKNTQQGGFDKTSADSGIEFGRWAWASMFADINNDGWDDLLIANGFLTGDQSGDL